ncbi:hypothetical protein CcaverHIS002_0202440 [Cutaneotrichosporon cavernicola]|uniref:Uncharacterized protein n=1 Tax=Cutaneotrichosporon cavernicola TaxID=279322 RepID=A0AA48I0C7_9TREE|nr:uncharacterized protein CcaverHIS019_0202460 [Cutaneotrichosporon cavernicola]BEI81084.1 hypothetical protein CcaverHIS002_0202440 [Cutaneotrichosporon cavernicola]BEI88884.1 hypothetical protein CcaverHIS019_0202460 [Cutaneotrichosporon cavernicola]BEI96661.1 hypothetical protein CcaverHIS631_0202500 [Cutaneotrichosporon cavernicola]BEJ04432.1 hypothetical protein CcaverHIS641_0202490 [Cutaneotrichosporon cavernicola]
MASSGEAADLRELRCLLAAAIDDLRRTVDCCDSPVVPCQRLTRRDGPVDLGVTDHDINTDNHNVGVDKHCHYTIETLSGGDSDEDPIDHSPPSSGGNAFDASTSVVDEATSHITFFPRTLDITDRLSSNVSDGGAYIQSSTPYLPEGPMQRSSTQDISRQLRKAKRLKFLKVLNLVMDNEPLDVLLPLRLTCHSLFKMVEAKLLWHFASCHDGIHMAARFKNEFDIDIETNNNLPRHVLDIRGPDGGCQGCNNDDRFMIQPCVCISKRLRQLGCLSHITFDMVRVWVNSDQHLENFEQEEVNILKAKTTVYIVKINHDPSKVIYLPTAPIGGSLDVTVIMVVDPAETCKLTVKPQFTSSEPNTDVTYSYIFVSNNPSWYTIPTTNSWPGAPVDDEFGFLDFFMDHFAQLQLAIEPALAYLVGSEAWPSDWMAAHRLKDEDWEHKYDVAVHNYVEKRVFPDRVKFHACRRRAEGLLKSEDMKDAIVAANRSYDWLSLAQFDERWQMERGLPLSFVLGC